jgi:hypothetical protein
VEVQVHRQEGDLPGYITIPETVVEFNAVINLDSVGEANMRRMEVSMAVPYPAFLRPSAEKEGILEDKLVTVGLDARKFLR